MGPVAASGAESRLAWEDGWTLYAIAGSFKIQQDADKVAHRVGDPWVVQNTEICVNYTPGYWIVVAGANSHKDALSWRRA